MIAFRKSFAILALLAGLGMAGTACRNQSEDAANNTNDTAGQTAPEMNTGDTTSLQLDTMRRDTTTRNGTGTGTSGTGTGGGANTPAGGSGH